MSTDMDDMRYAQRMGVGELWPHWSVCPQDLGRTVLNVAKRASRFLGKECPWMTHAACLEAIARGAGMPNWHALQALAQSMMDGCSQEDGRPRDSHESAARMAPAYPMLAYAPPSCAPTEEQQNGMRVFAERVGAAACVGVDTVLSVIAKLNGADSWLDLLARRAEDSAEPLYDFVVEEGGLSRGGRFRWSDACQELVRQQDALYQGYNERDEEQQRRCRERVLGVTSKRPDFLEGLLATADIIYPGYDNRRECGRVYATAIERAEALMPRKYKGQVSWLFVENRFYHRLLYGYMIWNIVYGSRKRALSLARKQLRMNLGDHLGIRYFLPVLLAADSRLSCAHKALDRIKSDEAVDAGAPFVTSLVLAAQGMWREAIRSLLHALFVYPPLRDVVASSNLDPWQPIAPSEKRRVVLDRQTLLDQYIVLTPHCRGLEEKFADALNHDSVKQTELQLEKLFRAWLVKRDADAHQTWVAAVITEAARLADVLEPTST